MKRIRLKCMVDKLAQKSWVNYFVRCTPCPTCHKMGLDMVDYWVNCDNLNYCFTAICSECGDHNVRGTFPVCTLSDFRRLKLRKRGDAT